MVKTLKGSNIIARGKQTRVCAAPGTMCQMNPTLKGRASTLIAQPLQGRNVFTSNRGRRSRFWRSLAPGYLVRPFQGLPFPSPVSRRLADDARVDDLSGGVPALARRCAEIGTAQTKKAKAAAAAPKSSFLLTPTPRGSRDRRVTYRDEQGKMWGFGFRQYQQRLCAAGRVSFGPRGERRQIIALFGRRAVGADAVAPLALGAVERGVGQLDQFDGVARVVRVGGH